jgi:hypothetical protein
VRIPTRLETVASNMSSKTFPNGRMLFTGSSTERVTNLASGESIDLRTAGSALFTPLPNGSLRIVIRGRALIYLLPEDVGGPALLLARGRVAEVLDTTTDTITSFRLRGKEGRRLCAGEPAAISTSRKAQHREGNFGTALSVSAATNVLVPVRRIS